MKHLIHILLLIVGLGSCKKPEDRACYKSTGNIVTELRAFGSFNAIVVEDNIQVEITQSTENSGEITAGKNLLNFITTEVENNTLYIRNTNKCNNLRSYKHKITLDLNIISLKYINLYGTKGIASTNTLKSDSLFIEGVDSHGDVSLSFEGEHIATIFHSGTSNIFISGASNSSYAYQISNGYTNYSDLSVNDCNLHSRTVQDCFMYAKEKLSVDIHGSGNVYYLDNSNLILTSKIKGTGELIAQ